MAIDEQKILGIMISKFNSEYTANHIPSDFLIAPIPTDSRYKYGFQATSTILGTPIIKFRIYFNLGKLENLDKFIMRAVDDAIAGEDYVFVTKGILTLEAISDNNSSAVVTNYDGRGFIDPTSQIINVTVILGTDEW